MKSIFNLATLIFILIFGANAICAQTETDKGIELYKKADYKNAVKTLKNASKNNSSDATSLYYLGLCYLQLNESKNATGVLRKAVEINDKFVEAYAALALAYSLRNEMSEASGAAQKCLSLNPKMPDAHYILGVVNLRSGALNYAYERAKKAIELNPQFAAAYYLKTEVLVNNFAVQSGTILNPSEQRYELLTEAAQSLQKYVTLIPAAKKTEFLDEYAKSLQFFSDYYKQPENRAKINLDGIPKNAESEFEIIQKSRPQYTPAARQAGISGTIKVLVAFGADGKVEHVLVTKSLGYGLDEEAARKSRQIKFHPEIKNGQPVSIVKTVVYSFQIG